MFCLTLPEAIIGMSESPVSLRAPPYPNSGFSYDSTNDEGLSLLPGIKPDTLLCLPFENISYIESCTRKLENISALH